MMYVSIYIHMHMNIFIFECIADRDAVASAEFVRTQIYIICLGTYTHICNMCVCIQIYAMCILIYVYKHVCV